MYIQRLQEAAKRIETDGAQGFWTAVEMVGMPTALAILIAHLRINHGAKKTWPADPEIDSQVAQLLKDEFPGVFRFLAHDCALFYMSPWYCLDNFSAFTVYYQGRLWPTAEHAYQAAKFEQKEMIERLLTARSAHNAKKIANDPLNAFLIRADWQEVMRDIMEEILRAKLTQHEYVRKKLRESQGMLLVEDSPRDGYWGRGPDWNGENWLGKIWMKIRDDPATVW